jgi:hypothetical protein
MFIRCERGNLESSLVLIPLLFLFLCSFQIISAIYIRNGEQLTVQSDASVRAISGEIAEGDQVIELAGSAGRFAPKLLLTHKKRLLPGFIPGLSSLMGHAISSTLTGVAVIEDS